MKKSVRSRGVSWPNSRQLVLEIPARAKAAATYALQPNWTMMIAAIATLFAFAAPTLLLTPEQTLEALAGYPGHRRLDKHYFLMRSVVASKARLAREDELSIAVIGGSTTRESLSDAKELSHILTQRTGQPVHVVDYTSGGQKLDTSALLAIHALCSGADIALVGISPSRLGTENTGDRTEMNFVRGYGLNLPQRAMEALGIGLPPVLTAERRFVATSLGLLPRYAIYDSLGLVSAGVKTSTRNWSNRHRYVSKPADSETARKRMYRAQKYHVKRFMEKESYLTLLKKLVAATRTCGGTLILFDTPMNPRFFKEAGLQPYAKAYEVYRAKIDKLAHEEGVPFFSSNGADLLEESDFYDFGHLQTWRAINRTTQLMAQEISAVAESTRLASRSPH